MATSVLIVEDEPLIALGVEIELEEAGYEICGVAATEAEAHAMGRETHPDMAVVDVRLAPGDGRIVARELADDFGTTVLMATSVEAATLDGIGALGVLPKPYHASDVPAALIAVRKMAEGRASGPLPDHMQRLSRD
jgi:DNA-binding response OmpR family regulator